MHTAHGRDDEEPSRLRTLTPTRGNAGGGVTAGSKSARWHGGVRSKVRLGVDSLGTGQKIGKKGRQDYMVWVIEIRIALSSFLHTDRQTLSDYRDKLVICHGFRNRLYQAQAVGVSRFVGSSLLLNLCGHPTSWSLTTHC